MTWEEYYNSEMEKIEKSKERLEKAAGLIVVCFICVNVVCFIGAGL